MATVLRAALHPRDIAISFSISTGNEALNGMRGFPRLSDRRRIHPCPADDGGTVPSSATLPGVGAQGACGRQANRAAASRPQRRRAHVRQDPYRCHERRLRGHAHLGVACRRRGGRHAGGIARSRRTHDPLAVAAARRSGGDFRLGRLQGDGPRLLRDLRPRSAGAIGSHQGRSWARSRPISSCRPIRSTSPPSRWSIPTSIARR